MENFEKNYKQVADTELWKLLVRLAGDTDRELVSAVGEVCAIGLNLSKDIIRFFPTFTLHDDVHSANVCRWMYILLGDRAEELTVSEAALLLMAACCHDIGMSVSDEQKRTMTDRSYPGWDDYFRRNLDDDEAFFETGVISDRMLRNFVRLHHHERIGENLRQSAWPELLTRRGIRRETLLTLCLSHGTSLSRSELRSQRNKYDLLLCAVLLRLADLLDYDTSRAPAVLFHHTGLDTPGSAEESRSAGEYAKNQAGTFEEYIEDGVIRYNAVYHSLQLEHDVQQYLDWVEQELNHCADNLAQTGSHWQDLRLPYKISTEGVERRGYASGKFCMTMDQDRVIELLAGKNLYSDPGVFVRELLQNSIDAVLMRVRQDPDFSLEQGRIIVDTWPDDTGDTWFRIRDNGTGMDEHIITNYFLKVGRSYYTSDEFRAANRHASGGKPYTAISRFGIGILSCFMNDPEGTELKISTKRFRSGSNNGIRLDVTGLHGYYYLAHEAQHPVYEDSFLKMPTPDGGDWGYRREPGTTICVRTNQFRLGSTQSFREILDKYVQFPEIRVEYHGPEGDKVYPTQQELMDAVHALNPDGVVKEYVHEIPESVITSLREQFSEFDSSRKPPIIIRYHPLEWATDTGKISGLNISIDIQSSVDGYITDFDGETYTPEIAFEIHGDLSERSITLEATLKIPDRVFRRVRKASRYVLPDHSISPEIAYVHGHQTFDSGVYADARRQYDKKKKHVEARHMLEKARGLKFVMSIDELIKSLGGAEAYLFANMMTAIQNTASANRSVCAYNGILAGENEIFETDDNTMGTLLLLHGDFMPSVNLARNKITGISKEAEAALKKLCKEMNIVSGLVSPAQ